MIILECIHPFSAVFAVGFECLREREFLSFDLYVLIASCRCPLIMFLEFSLSFFLSFRAFFPQNYELLFNKSRVCDMLL